MNAFENMSTVDEHYEQQYGVSFSRTVYICFIMFVKIIIISYILHV